MNGMFIAASGAASQLAALNAAASNLANSSTAGYRRLFTQVEAVGGGGSPYEYAVAGAGPVIDMSQGPLNRTGSPLDIGLSGPGFLVVQTPNGYAYTRDGELSVNSSGVVMAAGYPLVSSGGGPIKVGAGTVAIGSDGTISVDGSTVGQIALANPGGFQMAPMGRNLYRPTAGNGLPMGAPGTRVQQGFLEGSTGNVVGSLLTLVSAMRGYESAMNAVRSVGSDGDRAIQAFTMQA